MNKNTKLYKTEIENAVKVCLTYYLASTHSSDIVIAYSYKDSDYKLHTMTKAEIFDAVCINRNSKNELQIALRSVNAKRFEDYNASCKDFCTVIEFNEFKKNFPEGLSSGYVMEFLFRNKLENESLEDIKKANNSKAYYKDSDTKSGLQIKKLDKNGASLASLELIKKACIAKNIIADELINAVEFLNKMYESEE